MNSLRTEWQAPYSLDTGETGPTDDPDFCDTDLAMRASELASHTHDQLVAMSNGDDPLWAQAASHVLGQEQTERRMMELLQRRKPR